MKSRKATFRQAQEALNRHTDTILRQIPLERVQLSLPTDGAGVRLKVSVEKGSEATVPRDVRVDLDGTELDIPVEAVGDYQEMKAY